MANKSGWHIEFGDSEETLSEDELLEVMALAITKGLLKATTQEEKQKVFQAALIEYRMAKKKRKG